MPERYSSDTIKHMEMIQGVIARLANEAALIRGWALTVSSAIFGFAVTSLSWRVAAVGLLPVFVFWGLNAYYLRAERKYRALYDRVRKGDLSEAFCMDSSKEEVEPWWRTNFSVTLWPFYGAIVGVGVILIFAGLCQRDQPTLRRDNSIYFLN
jgi:hypothetical protein